MNEHTPQYARQVADLPPEPARPRAAYAPPAVSYEARLEVRAGTPLGLLEPGQELLP
jgi:hypothetical protein